MGNREKTYCQKRKSCAEKPDEVGHNAEATKWRQNPPDLTTYVNSCNHQTPDVVRKMGKTTNILF